MPLLVAILAVFGLAGLLPILIRWLGRDAGYVGAATLTGLALWLLSLAGPVLDGEPVTYELPWLPAAGVTFALRMDTVGVLFAVIVLGIGAVVLAYAARYFARDDRAKTTRILSLLTFFAGSMLGLVLADDLLLVFLFWELTSVASFFLIGGLGEGKQGALRAFLTTAIGGLALLAAVVLLTITTGTSSLSGSLGAGDVVTGSAAAPAIIVLLLLAVATKSAQLPFHFWLPGAMVAPTPVSTYLHAATMVKAGIYLLFRFTPLFGQDLRWQVPVVLLGLTTAVFGAVVASNRNDLKSLLAYSTVSQLGLLTGLIGIGTPLALAAAALHTLAHALYKATLFMTVGIVEHETGTRDLRELGGLRRGLPLTAAAGGLAAISMAGLPPLLGFVSKEEAFAAFVGAGGPTWLGPVAATLAVAASIGTLVYSARYYLRTFEGPVRTQPHAAPASFAAPALLTGVLGVGLALVLPRLDPLVNGVSRDTTGDSADLHLALWHGFTLPLWLSAVVVLVGGLLVLAARQIEAAQGRFTLPAGSTVFDRCYDAAIRLGALVGRQASPHAPAPYLLPVFGLVALGGLVAARGVEMGELGPAAPSLTSDWAVVALLAACIVGVLRARTRLAAIATLGLTGFTVAAWFILLGAPDLALTQLLVETLTVSLVVVVFRRLPTTFVPRERVRERAAALVAITAGGTATAATYLLTGRRELSEVGGRLLAEGEQLTGGTNVVNTILVDFRALDTLGEITVIATAAAAIVALVRLTEHGPIPRPDGEEGTTRAAEGWGGIGMIDSPLLRSATTLLAPSMVLASVWLLLRGHDAVGGGFIGGLTGGAAVVLLYFSRGHQHIWGSRFLRTLMLAGAGLLVAVAYGLGGLLVTGAFLDGAKVVLPFGLEVAASLVFDIGVYLVVIAVVVAILRHLGQGIPEEPPDPERMVGATAPAGAGDREVRS